MRETPPGAPPRGAPFVAGREHRRPHLGLIRVITLQDEVLLNKHGRIVAGFLPEWTVSSWCIPDQPRGVHDEATFTAAVPKVVGLATDITNSAGIDVLVVSCMDDPGVREAREEVSVPVLGAGSATAAVARALAGEEVIGGIGISNQIPKGFEGILTPCFWRNPPGVRNTLDLLTDGGRRAVLKEAEALKLQGARVVVLGCTGMCTVGLGKEIERRTGMMVVDPLRSVSLLAEAVVERVAGGGGSVG